MGKDYDVVIIGAGIAGASLAYRLAERGLTRVAIIEAESRPGHHASGRSAAVLLRFRHHPIAQRAVEEAAAFMRAPPADFTDRPLLDPTGVILLFDQPDWDRARPLAAEVARRGVRVEVLSPSGLTAHLPTSAVTDVAGALWFPEDGRLDVRRLLHAYLDYACRHGAELLCDTVFHEACIANNTCTGVLTSAGVLNARWVVNAAGAWAGHVGLRSGATDVAWRTRRRTVIVFDAPAGAGEALAVARWPLISYESRQLYFAPEEDGLLASPMDEELVAPEDDAPNPAMIQRTCDRLHAYVPDIAPKILKSSRAGIRTFAPDGQIVVGEDARLRGFFWLAGQGGWGIEGSPTVSRIAADLIVDNKSDWPGVAAISPRRFLA